MCVNQGAMAMAYCPNVLLSLPPAHSRLFVVLAAYVRVYVASIPS